MAVYYVSPYTTTNGTGTFESPFAYNGTGRPTLFSGDEVRIVSRYLTDLLTPTVYTATLTSSSQLTITAGGGLGADFAQYNIVYLPDQGTFFKITGVSGNVISTNTNGIIPWGNSTSGVNITVRKVDLTAYSQSSLNTYYIWGSSIPDNVSISDGWVGDNVRVTDGTAKSLCNTISTGSITANDASVMSQSRNNCVVSLANTHIMPGNSLTGNCTFRFFLSGATYTIGQIFSNGTQSSTNVGTSTSPFTGGSITINHLNGYYTMTNVFAKGTTITINNCYSAGYDLLLFAGNSNNNPSIKDCTLNIGNIRASGTLGSDRALVTGALLFENTYNFNGVVDVFNNVSVPLAIARAFGKYVVNFGSGFAFYLNRRSTTVTSVSNRFLVSQYAYTSADVVVPTINLPTGFTVTGEPYSLGSFPQISHTGSSLTRLPRISRIVMPSPVSNGTYYPAVQPCVNRNYLITFTNGNFPVELLPGFSPQLSANNSFNGASVPLATSDFSIFRTVAPSIRTTLSTRDSMMFVDRDSRARKTIKIPVISGQSYTVSGYVRNNITSFANGDVRMCIVNMVGDEVVGQDMTTASNSAWEQFTLTFTAPETAEYHLVMEMYFINAGSIWLDDLTIT